MLKAIILVLAFFSTLSAVAPKPVSNFSKIFKDAFSNQKDEIDEILAVYKSSLDMDNQGFMVVWAYQVSNYISQGKKTDQSIQKILKDFLFRMTILPDQELPWQDLFCRTIGLNIAKVIIDFIQRNDYEDLTYKDLAIIHDLFIVFGCHKDPFAGYCMVPGLKSIIEREWGFGLDFIIILFQEQLKDYINVCKTFGIHKDFCF